MPNAIHRLKLMAVNESINELQSLTSKFFPSKLIH